jgi:hypothetical protein
MHPAYNRLAAFDGRLLHGVVPGHGCPPSTPPHQAAVNPKTTSHIGRKDKGKKGTEVAAGRNAVGAEAVCGHQAPRRVTFMVAFWKGPMSTTPRSDGAPCASQPVPTTQSPFWKEKGVLTWPELFATAPPLPAAELVVAADEVVPVALAPVEAVWERVDDPIAGGSSSTGGMPGYEQCFQGF